MRLWNAGDHKLVKEQHGRMKIVEPRPGRLHDEMRRACDRERVVIHAAWRIENEKIAGVRALDGFGCIVEGLNRT